MNQKIEKYAKILELDKILSALSAHTSFSGSAELAAELAPVSSIDEVDERLSLTEETFFLMARYGAPTITRIHSVASPLKRAEIGAVLSPVELLRIGEVLRMIRSVSEWRSRFSNEETKLDFLFFALSPNRFLEDSIHNAILSEEEIADNASPELATIRRKIRSAESRAREALEKIVRGQSYQKYLQDNIITIRDGRFVVPVKAEYRTEISGLIHDTSSSGATLFIEPMAAVSANNEIRILHGKEQEEIERILSELSASCASFGSDILSGYNLLCQIDFLFAKAKLGYQMNAQRPKLNDRGEIFLKGARHPLIDPDKVVATDISLGKDFDCLVITGPNTGGKTVTLKTIGLLTLMTMCGLLIPVRDGSIVSVFDKILVDIGDEQSIEQSLSTFSAHMTNIISILGEADITALALIDELGAGTDPVEGAALAVAILESLRKKGCKIAATTHYAELKVYALTTARVENGSCEFDVNTLKPTYRLLIGVPGRSNAFAISTRLGLDESIVEAAKGFMDTESRRFEDVIENLEASRQTYEQKAEEAEQLRISLKELKRETEAEKERSYNQREQEMELARKEARELVRRAERETEKLLEELQEIKRQKDSATFSENLAKAKSGMRSRLNAIKDEADPVIMTRDNSNYTLPRPLKKGDEVLILDLDRKGTVLDVSSSGQVTVAAGIVKTKVSLSNLRLIEGGKKEQTASVGRRGVRGNAERNAESQIDIRGMNVEEATMVLDQYIDNAVLANIPSVTIIHGKGTGVLRAGVHSYLRRHKCIRTFRLGTFGEGEMGVTIAELK